MGESKLTVGQVNDILEELSIQSLKRKYTLVAEEEDSNYGEELEQCEYSYKTHIFRLGIDDLHLKVVDICDSYGDYRGITSIKVVRPVIKQITDFE